MRNRQGRCVRQRTSGRRITSETGVPHLWLCGMYGKPVRVGAWELRLDYANCTDRRLKGVAVLFVKRAGAQEVPARRLVTLGMLERAFPDLVNRPISV